MSFNANPDLYEYGAPPNVCPLCFAAGKSPDPVFVCFTGIKIGAAWVAPDPPPPNGIYELPATNPCEWQKVFGPWRYTLDFHIDLTHLAVWDLGAVWPFLHGVTTECDSWIANGQINPGLKYYGGYAVIVPPLPGGDFSSQELLDLLGINPRSDVWVNPRPDAAEASISTLSRRRDSTNIKVLYDHS